MRGRLNLEFLVLLAAQPVRTQHAHMTQQLQRQNVYMAIILRMITGRSNLDRLFTKINLICLERRGTTGMDEFITHPSGYSDMPIKMAMSLTMSMLDGAVLLGVQLTAVHPSLPVDSMLHTGEMILRISGHGCDT